MVKIRRNTRTVWVYRVYYDLGWPYSWSVLNVRLNNHKMIFSAYILNLFFTFWLLFFHKFARNKDIWWKNMSHIKSKIKVIWKSKKFNLITTPLIPTTDHRKANWVLLKFFSTLSKFYLVGKSQIFGPTWFQSYILLFTNFEFKIKM